MMPECFSVDYKCLVEIPVSAQEATAASTCFYKRPQNIFLKQ